MTRSAAPPLSQRLQPSLLDRLAGDDADAAGTAMASNATAAASAAQWRAAVLRDLHALLNATGAGDALAAWPLAGGSVIGLGLPAFAGRPAAALDPDAVARALREAILRFEPRLLPHSLRVRPQPRRGGGCAHNVLAFSIEALLWAQPVPLALWLRTEMDLESGRASVREAPAPAERI